MQWLSNIRLLLNHRIRYVLEKENENLFHQRDLNQLILAAIKSRQPMMQTDQYSMSSPVSAAAPNGVK